MTELDSRPAWVLKVLSKTVPLKACLELRQEALIHTAAAIAGYVSRSWGELRCPSSLSAELYALCLSMKAWSVHNVLRHNFPGLGSATRACLLQWTRVTWLCAFPAFQPFITAMFPFFSLPLFLLKIFQYTVHMADSKLAIIIVSKPCLKPQHFGILCIITDKPLNKNNSIRSSVIETQSSIAS